MSKLVVTPSNLGGSIKAGVQASNKLDVHPEKIEGQGFKIMPTRIDLTEAEIRALETGSQLNVGYFYQAKDTPFYARASAANHLVDLTEMSVVDLEIGELLNIVDATDTVVGVARHYNVLNKDGDVTSQLQKANATGAWEDYALVSGEKLVRPDGGAAVTGTTPDVKFYVREKYVREPHEAGAVAHGKGNMMLISTHAGGLKHEGDSGPADDGAHSIVEYDSDNLPFWNGYSNTVETNTTTADINDTDANPDVTIYDGLVYVPKHYTSGKKLTKFEFYEASDSTRADFMELYVSTRSNEYTVARQDLKKVYEGSPGDPIVMYSFDMAQAGRHVRFMFLFSDKEGNAQTYLRVRLTYTDGTSEVLALADFLNNLQGITEFPASTLEKIAASVDPDTGIPLWKDMSGSDIDAPADMSLLKEVEADYAPPTFTVQVHTDSKTVEFTSVAGGVGPYQYSIDNGLSWGVTETVALPAAGFSEILPRVKDAKGVVSGVMGATAYREPRKEWRADFVTPGSSVLSFPGPRGWHCDSADSETIGSDIHLEENDSALSWVYEGSASVTGSFLFFGQGLSGVAGKATASLAPLFADNAGKTVDGQRYTVGYDIYDESIGAANPDVHYFCRVLDAATGDVIAEREHVTTGNEGANSKSNLALVFFGNGAEVELQFHVDYDDAAAGADATNDYLRVNSVGLYKERSQRGGVLRKDGANNRIDFYNLDGPAGVETVEVDVSEYKGKIYPWFTRSDRTGALDVNNDYVEYSYAIDGGNWVSMDLTQGATDRGNVRYRSSYVFGEGVDVSSASTIKYRVEMRCDREAVTGNRGIYLNGIGHKERWS